MATAEARLTDGSGALYAHATSTLMVFRPKDGAKETPEEGEPGAVGAPREE